MASVNKLYYYDNYGWLTDKVDNSRSTLSVPPSYNSESFIYPNWTGHRWVLLERIPEKSFQELRDELSIKLEEQRQLVQSQGVSFDFSDGPGIIQTRDIKDIMNVNGQVTAALILHNLDQPLAELVFRDIANVNHNLVPSEMIALGMVVTKWISDTYKMKWNHQEQIDQLQTIDDLENYDYTANWNL